MENSEKIKTIEVLSNLIYQQEDHINKQLTNVCGFTTDEQDKIRKQILKLINNLIY